MKVDVIQKDLRITSISSRLSQMLRFRSFRLSHSRTLKWSLSDMKQPCTRGKLLMKASLTAFTLGFSGSLYLTC